MNNRKLLRKLLASPANARFDDVLRLTAGFGFRLARVSGSHHLLIHSATNAMLNLQEVGGEAKPYQVRQFLRIVELHNLTLEDER